MDHLAFCMIPKWYIVVDHSCDSEKLFITVTLDLLNIFVWNNLIYFTLWYVCSHMASIY